MWKRKQVNEYEKSLTSNLRSRDKMAVVDGQGTCLGSFE